MYDLLTAKPVSGYDGGLVAYTAGAIAGVIWHDQNYNGVRDQAKQAIRPLRYSWSGGTIKLGVGNRTKPLQRSA